MADIKLDILTPLGAKREGIDVAGVEVPGIQGELGLLPHHEALVTAVAPGVIRFRDSGSVRMAVGAGFLEVKEAGRIVVLVEQALEGDEIDLGQAKSDRDAARKELDAFAGAVDSPEHRSLHTKWAWADAQVRAAS